MISPAIHFEKVSLSFNHTPLLDNFSNVFPAGKCTCLLGPSGCGKSTMLGLVARRESLKFRGSVFFEPAADPATHVSWMSQDDLLLPWLTVLDNVLLGAKLRHEVDSGKAQQARELLEKAGLAGMANVYPEELSGGMRQRVALLRTLLEERPVILMDEPFSALDALTRMKLQDLSSKLTRGKTVLLVTHDPMEALRIGDKIVVLKGIPVQVETAVDLETAGPRNIQPPEIAEKYAELMKLLMESGGE